MPDCNYCDRSFDSEEEYHEHLASEHEGELSRIDRRRVDGVESDDGGGIPTGPAVLIGVIGFAVAMVVWVVFFFGSGGASGTVNGIDVDQTPGQTATHFHGLINVTIDGQQLDFSRPEFQNPRQFPAFHFEGGDGEVWHGHRDGLTLEYAMATLGIEVSENSVTYNGTTYDGSDPDTTVRVLVDGESVDPTSYELTGASVPNAERGDFIRIVVETQ
jgi:hypothetical protein